MASAAASFLRYVLYGVLTCAAVVVPWMVVQEILRRLPGGDNVDGLFRSLALPDPVHALALAVVVAIALGLVGWFGHRFLWPRLETIPLFRSLLPGVEQLLQNLGTGEGRQADRVVWVAWPSARVRTLGIVTGHVRDPGTGRDRLAVVMFPNAGQPKATMLRVVELDQIEQAGWTLDEAIRFVTSSGTMGPGGVISPPKSDTGESARS